MPSSQLLRKLAIRALVASSIFACWHAQVFAQEENTVFESSETGLEFSIQVPPLWTIEKNFVGYTAVFKPSAKAPRIKLPKGMKADPSITVAASLKPLEISEEALEENARDIEENFIKSNGRMSEFQIFQKTIVRDLSQGASGLLYYIAYKSSGVDVGQAVLIMGHEQGRFRVTLSDHRLNFDKNLETYYPYMVSLKYKQPEQTTAGKFRYDYVVWGVSVIMVSAILGLNARRKREKIRSRNTKSTRSLSRERAALSLPMDSVISSAPASEYVGEPRESYSGVVMSDSPTGASEIPEPAFSVGDLSAPPQSIPLSQVVDESSAPPSVRRRWSALLGNKSSVESSKGKKSEDDPI
ncbi:MAG: hypothetical protein RJB13_1482 [Pseudomonadota bacterium]